MRRILFVKAANEVPMVTFPLGLMYLSSAAKAAFDDVETQLYDLRLADASMEGLRKSVQSFRPDLVAVSALSVESGCLNEVAGIVKRSDPEAKIVIGGPYSSSEPDGGLVQHPNVDFAARGEGEETFVELLKGLADPQPDFGETLGLCWRDETGRIVANPDRPYIEALEEIAPPDYALGPMESYWNEWSMSDVSFQRFHRYMNLFTSRACPYKCTYCHDLFGKGFRARSPQHVVDEMAYLQKTYGVTEFEILDDIFNFDIDRAKTICREIVDRGIEATLSFPNGLRCDRLDDELIGLLKKCGTRHISIAVETATPRLQKQIKKNLKLEKVWEAIESCRRHRIATRGFFMLGFPSETREELNATVDFACRSKLTVANFFIVIPYKGTKLEEENREMIESMNIDYSGIDYWTSSYNLSAVSEKELKRIQRLAILRFILSPRRVVYVLSSHPQPFKAFLFGLRGFVHALWTLTSLKRPNLRKKAARIRDKFALET